MEVRPTLDKWTIKFMKQLQKPYKGLPASVVQSFGNAAKAEKNLGLPQKLWMKLTEESEKIDDDWLLETSLFMAGVAVGWNEATKKAKHGLDEQKS